MSLVSLYRYLVYKTNSRLFGALQFRESAKFQFLLLARNLLVDGEATYLALLADQQQQNWADLPGVYDSEEFPVRLSAEDLDIIEGDSEGAALGIHLMQDIRERVGRRFLQADGLVM
ncbi:hypothetical protein V1509DRAFT_643609, partial [Lipomyces kononenkoae]